MWLVSGQTEEPAHVVRVKNTTQVALMWLLL